MGPSDRIECAKQLLRLGKSVTEAAESAGYSSKSGFREMFQKLEGEDPFKWARDRGPLERVAATVRIAERLLVETNDPIGRIATSIGYTDRGLQKAFRKVHGITPGQWRAKNAP